MDIFAQLKSVEEFSAVDISVIEWLAARTHVYPVRRGRQILNNIDFVHVVLKGRLQVICLTGCVRKLIVEELGPMQLIGHIQVLARVDHNPIVMLQTAQDCEIGRIRASDFRYLIKLFPQVSDIVMRNISISHLALSKKIAELTMLSAKARLYLYILRLTEGKQNNDVLAPTHETIAAHIGSHREAVTREMRELERMGLLSYTRGAIRMIDFSGLCALFRASVANEFSTIAPGSHDSHFSQAANA